jgi:hypothetical protein
VPTDGAGVTDSWIPYVRAVRSARSCRSGPVSALEGACDSIRRVDEAATHGLELSRGTADAAASVKQATDETVAAMGNIDSRFGVLQSTIAELGSRSAAIGDGR